MLNGECLDKMIKLSDYVFEFLKEKGVKHAFMLPGGGAMHLVDSLGKSEIEYFTFLHEQGASIAAEAYAQHTNTPGLVLVTSGPGATNAITAVTAGWIDSTPMIIISGQAKRSDLVGDRGVRQIGSQEVQIIPMVTPITKYAAQILEPNDIRFHLEKAYHEAMSGRPGPVWLDIPLDVQGAMIDEDSLREFEDGLDSRDENDNEEIRSAARKTIELLRNSKKPLLLAGNGIKLAGGEENLYRLLELVRIPVQTTWKTIDMFDENYPLYVGHPGIMGDRGANHIIQECDLLISVGSRLDSSITAFNEPHFAYNASKVIVDIDVNEIQRMNMDIEVSCACDAGVFIDNICDLINISETGDKLGNWNDWILYCKALREKNPVVTDKHREANEYVSAYSFIDELCKLLRTDDVIVPESSGGAGEITYQAFRIQKGQKMKNAAGLGSMGFGLPYAIGACIANNKRRTILINGDGAFQLNIQELQTLKHLRLPVKIFIWCNEGYASIRSMQRNNFEGNYVGSSRDSGHTIPDIIKVADSYGLKTAHIGNNSELGSKLRTIMADDESVLCTIDMDPSETISPRVKAYIEKDGTIRSGVLEKMWPFQED